LISSLLTQTSQPGDVLASLEGVCAASGLGALAGRLGELRPWLDGDLADVESALTGACDGETLAERSARHLLACPGKRLRPLCVALASRVGSGFGPAARELAIAVELVHNATLLHDDVVDLGDLRRGSPAARTVYGNAASIFGGDWLLVDALCRIERAAIPGVLPRMLDVIKAMVIAESWQLAARGRLEADRARYFAIVDGKTASLFRWAMFSGGRAGGASDAACEALETYGGKLGLAFQIVDDLLDVVGDPAETGKETLADLREGKMTYPLIVAAEREPEVARLLAELAAEGQSDASSLARRRLEGRIAEALAHAEVASACNELAGSLCAEAVAALSDVPAGPARDALEAVAVATLGRRK
jgi:octaprenyl-diphosphate synthase